jgi:hypothetical protein
MNNTEVFLRVADSERDQYIHASADVFVSSSIAFAAHKPLGKTAAKVVLYFEICCNQTQ